MNLWPSRHSIAPDFARRECKALKSMEYLVAEGGIEPPTYGL